MDYFAVFGIGETVAYQLMPVVGLVDILIGFSLLVHPTRAAIAWLVFWGLFTAFLRPLSGEHFAEFLERAGNYGAPMALLLITTKSNLYARMKPKPLYNDMANMQSVVRLLQVMSALLIFSHGWLNIIEKQGLVLQYKALGFTNPEAVAQIVGFSELLAAAFIILLPRWEIVFVVFCWKVISETPYPHFGLFEWIERGGSYGVLLSLTLALNANRSLIVSLIQYISLPRMGRVKIHG